MTAKRVDRNTAEPIIEEPIDRNTSKPMIAEPVDRNTFEPMIADPVDRSTSEPMIAERSRHLSRSGHPRFKPASKRSLP
jgi:hypothetical protein